MVKNLIFLFIFIYFVYNLLLISSWIGNQSHDYVPENYTDYQEDDDYQDDDDDEDDDEDDDDDDDDDDVDDNESTSESEGNYNNKLHQT